MRISDWSSDVCSSDLSGEGVKKNRAAVRGIGDGADQHRAAVAERHGGAADARIAAGSAVRGQLGQGGKVDRPRIGDQLDRAAGRTRRSEEHTSELQSLMRISYAVFCLKKKRIKNNNHIAQNDTKIHR